MQKHREYFKKFLEKAYLKFGKKFNYSLVDYVNSQLPVEIICSMHGIFKRSPSDFLKSERGCQMCAKEFVKTKRTNKALDSFIKKSKHKFEGKFDYSLVNFVNSKTPVEIICPIHGKFKQRIGVHMKAKYGCDKCAEVETFKGLKYFIDRANYVHNFMFDYSMNDIDSFKKSCDKIKIKCKNGHIFEQQINSHCNGRGCKICNEPCHDTESFIELASVKHHFKYDYSKVNYIKQDVPIIITCPIHGDFLQRPMNHLHLLRGCSKCKQSKGENIIRFFLEENNIKYIPQKKFRNCKNINELPFDFYLIDYNICIEYDGQQHFKPIKKYGGGESFKKLKIRDKIKTNYCQDSNIVLIRIAYNENVIEKLKAELLKHFVPFIV